MQKLENKEKKIHIPSVPTLSNSVIVKVIILKVCKTMYNEK